MECNKDEALRAKEIAVKKMENNDFAGACKIASKAQRLYPNLENISQMICVCEVHCSAENNNFGNEKDWYGILQLSQAADDVLIKKQYRKLALLLHPDKNKFAGAEAAFKLIGEAQRMLLDKEKRSLYDLKRRNSTRPMASNRPPSQGIVNMSVARPPMAPETFWTHCPFCSVRYQYYKDVLNRALRCQACTKPFIAYDLGGQGMQNWPSSNQNAKYSQIGVPGHNVPHNSFSNNGNFHQQKPTMNSFSKTGRDANVDRMHKPNSSPKDTKRASKAQVPDGSSSSTKTNRKRGKKQETRESLASESTLDSRDADGHACMTPGVKAKQKSNSRRSARNKRHVSYNESGSDKEEIGCPSKRPKVDGMSSFAEGTEHASSKDLGKKANSSAGDEKAHKYRTDNGASMGNVGVFPLPRKETLDASSKEELGEATRRSDKLNGEATAKETQSKSSKVDHDSAANSSSDASDEETVLQEYPDADFSDFDEVRNVDRFKVGQIWAVYDTADAMPRFYVQVKKVFAVGFKLRITWLEPDPVSENELLWVRKELPVSCGRYKLGHTENTEDRLMFSHPISLGEKSGSGAFWIYPRKGEIWALFKDWHIGWISAPDSPSQYEYQFFEVLSDYDDTLGVRVACLRKLKGFGSLFCRLGGDEIQIPATECLRFSHRVLSFTMSGRERDGVPRGSFELDPSCISPNLEEIALPPEMKVGAEDHLSTGPSSEYVDVNSNGKVQPTASPTRHHNFAVDAEIDEHATSPEPGLEEVIEIPEPEFFDFEATKALDKFHIGQVWALYSDVDGLPKFYACIKKVDIHSRKKLHVAWFEAGLQPLDLLRWKDKEVPISCGRFKKKSRSNQAYSDAGAFSHQVVAEATSKKNEFEIYPKKGEIWALYKNWSVEISASELLSCDFDIVEVQEKSMENSLIRVSVLERVSGYKSVFRSQTNNSLAVPLRELLRFSHQIPSYQLTNEKGGSLQGCWELDPAALPSTFFCKN